MNTVEKAKQKHFITSKSASKCRYRKGPISFSYKSWAILTLVLILSILVFFQLLQKPFSSAKEGVSTTISKSENVPVLVFANTSITNSQITDIELSKAQSLLQQGNYLNTAVQRREIDDYAFYALFDRIELARQSKIHGGLSTNALMKLIAPLSSISSSKSHQFYENHPFLFARSAPRIHVREIMVGNNSLAQRIQFQLSSGVSFSLLAQQYSVDPEQYKKQGGDLGWVTQGQMPMEWDAIAFSLSKGQVSQIFRVANLYCILQVIEGPSYDTTPYDFVSPPVPIVAAAYIQQQQFLTWLSNHITHEALQVLVSTYSQSIKNALTDLQTHPDQGFMGNL